MNVAIAIMLAVFAIEACAQASATVGGRGPFDVQLLATYGWVFALSLLGGAASWAKKVREGHTRAFNLVELVGELVISSFAGMFTFFLCRWAGVNDWLSAALIGIAGHMGSRAIFLGEQLLERWFGRINPPAGDAK